MATATPDANKAVAAPYFEVLINLGFRPEFNEYGNVLFLFEGGRYQIIPDVEFPLYLRLFYPNYCAITDENRVRVWGALNRANLETRVAKTIVMGDNVSSVVETLLPDHAFFKEKLMAYLAMLKASAQRFLESVKA